MKTGVKVTERPLPPWTQKRSVPSGGSMRCPRCGAGTVVVDSRPRDKGVARRRCCPQCNLRIRTFEKAGDSEDLHAMLRQAAVQLRKMADEIDHYDLLVMGGRVDEEAPPS